MLCSFPLFVKPYYNKPIFHSIDQAKNYNSSIGSSSYGPKNRPNPIRTTISTNQEKFHKHQYFYDSSLAKEKPKQDEDGFKKAKSRTLKNIYRELKKVKQPISHGGRLSSFLNSLFTNGKKAKISSNDDRKLKSANASTCSSFSRLCLSKDIISTPCGNKNFDMEVEDYVHENHELKFHKNNIEDEDDDDEGASCASSDLFELDIFSSIGLMGLHVYETTNLDTNLDINANFN